MAGGARRVKPRLDPAPLTEWDQRIWALVAARFPCRPLSTLWLSMDRSDADLMLDMQRHKWAQIFALPDEGPLWESGCEVRGRVAAHGPYPGHITYRPINIT